MHADTLQSISQPLNVPVHVAIIMDGNGRWAKARGLPRTAGHKRGAEAVKRALQAAGELGISYLTLFGFSSENWQRPESEVQDLMALLRFYLKHDIQQLVDGEVRLNVIGDRGRFPDEIVELIKRAEQQTAAGAKLVLTIALSYGGRQEIVYASRRLAEDCVAEKVRLDDIDEDKFASHLFTSDIPDPDLLIRTGGEQRVSNFLLWQLAYTELVFSNILWPDFGYEGLEQAIITYQRRERRYGAVTN